MIICSNALREKIARSNFFSFSRNVLNVNKRYLESKGWFICSQFFKRRIVEPINA